MHREAGKKHSIEKLEEAEESRQETIHREAGRSIEKQEGNNTYIDKQLCPYQLDQLYEHIMYTQFLCLPICALFHTQLIIL